MTDLTKESTPEQVQEAWVQALRSGPYRQGQNVLRSAGNEFCCLGVLCDLAVQAGVAEWVPPTLGVGYYTVRVADGEKFASVVDLPPSIAKWAGVRGTDAKIEETFAQTTTWRTTTLTSMNDMGEVPFSGIADVIEGGHVLPFESEEE